MNGLISIIVFIPILASIIILALLRNDKFIRRFSFSIVSIELLLTIFAFSLYDKAKGGIQLVDFIEGWIPIKGFNANYLVGIDGLSAPLVLLSGILGAAAVWGSWRIKNRVKEYFALLLFLQGVVIGVFVSLDLLLFFIFWEAELIPMYFLISIWGSGRAHYSAAKFVIFTLFAGALLIIGILAIYLSQGINSFTMVSIPELSLQGIPELMTGANFLIPVSVIFWLFFISFAIKLPLWPLHSWVPDAHTDAPTAVSVMLAGILLKMGGYGIFRISLGFFKNSSFNFDVAAPILVILGAISVIYGAILTIRQTDLKRLIAFSSVSHMGYVIIGFSSLISVVSINDTLALNGAALQLFTHGTITGLAFLLVGLVYDRTHTRYIPDLGGLTAKMPIIAIFFLIAGFGSLGLPGLSGFVAELMIFLGTFQVGNIFAIATVIGVFGVVLAAGYTLWMIQRSFFGNKPSKESPVSKDFEELSDMHILDVFPVLVLTIPIFVVGIYPRLLTDIIEIGIREMFLL